MVKRLSILATIIIVLSCMTGCGKSGTGGNLLALLQGNTTATRVYGQGGIFTTNTENNGGISADSLYSPGAAVADYSGVYIADINNHRVLYYEGTSTTATRVYGQAGSFTTNEDNKGGSVSGATLHHPFCVAAYSDRVYIADTDNNRVLLY
jgi:hypothetical protein